MLFGLINTKAYVIRRIESPYGRGMGSSSGWPEFVSFSKIKAEAKVAKLKIENDDHKEVSNGTLDFCISEVEVIE